MLSVEHVHTFSLAYAHWQLSMCTLLVEHVHAFTWLFAHFQLNMFLLSVEHVHTSVGHVHACRCMCTLLYLPRTLENDANTWNQGGFRQKAVHYRYRTSSFVIWACTWIQFSMWTLFVEHGHAFTWACACFHLSMHTLAHTSSWACACF